MGTSLGTPLDQRSGGTSARQNVNLAGQSVQLVAAQGEQVLGLLFQASWQRAQPFCSRQVPAPQLTFLHTSDVQLDHGLVRLVTTGSQTRLPAHNRSYTQAWVTYRHTEATLPVCDAPSELAAASDSSGWSSGSL